MYINKKPRFLWSLQLILLSTACATIFAALRTLIEARQNEYIDLGFWRTIFMALRDHTTASLTVSAAVSAICAVYFAIWSAISKKADLAARLTKPNRIIAAIISLSGVLFIIATHSLIHGSTSRSATCMIILLGLLWFIAVTLLQKNVFKTVSWLQSKQFVSDFLGASLLIVVLLPLLKDINIREYKNLEMASAALLSLLLAVLIFKYGFVTIYTASDHKKRTGPLALSLMLTLLISISPAILWLASPTVTSKKPQLKNPWNVIIIGIDTLRADRTTLLGPSEKGRQLTPNLARLAKRGTIFTNALSQSSWTLPAFASIFTGKYPYQHGAVSYPKDSLDAKELTIAETMRQAGYYTGAIIANFYISSRCGLDQGYTYLNDDNVSDAGDVTSHAITDTAIQFLDKNKDKNFLLFAHYFDPHANYVDHETIHYADSYSGWLTRINGPLGGSGLLNNRREILGYEDIEYVKDVYDEEVLYTDRHIGRLIDHINATGLDKNTMIIVVSDHGEEFMEHGRMGHVNALYNEVTHVPMMVILPGNQKTESVNNAVVETRSIYSTVLDFLGLPNNLKTPPPSLGPLLYSQKVADNANEAYSMHDGSSDTSRLSSIWTDKWRFIIDYTRQKEFLFDAAADPKEQSNIIEQHPDVARMLREKLNKTIPHTDQNSINDETTELTEEEIKRLKSLGYIK